MVVSGVDAHRALRGIDVYLAALEGIHDVLGSYAARQLDGGTVEIKRQVSRLLVAA